MRDSEAPVEGCGILAAADDQIVGPPGEALGYACDRRLQMSRPGNAGDVARAREQTGDACREIRHEDVRVRDVDPLPAEKPGDPADEVGKRENVQRQASAIEVAAEVHRHFVMSDASCRELLGEIASRRVDDCHNLESPSRQLGTYVREPWRVTRRRSDLRDTERPTRRHARRLVR